MSGLNFGSSSVAPEHPSQISSPSVQLFELMILESIVLLLRSSLLLNPMSSVKKIFFMLQSETNTCSQA